MRCTSFFFRVSTRYFGCSISSRWLDYERKIVKEGKVLEGRSGGRKRSGGVRVGKELSN